VATSQFSDAILTTLSNLPLITFYPTNITFYPTSIDVCIQASDTSGNTYISENIDVQEINQPVQPKEINQPVQPKDLSEYKRVLDLD
jgi:hypothetical protein